MKHCVEMHRTQQDPFCSRYTIFLDTHILDQYRDTMERSAKLHDLPLIIQLPSNFKGIGICLDDAFKIRVHLPLYSVMIPVVVHMPHLTILVLSKQCWTSATEVREPVDSKCCSSSALNSNMSLPSH